MLAVLLAQVKLRGIEDINEELEFLLESGQGEGSMQRDSFNGQQIAAILPTRCQILKHIKTEPVQARFESHFETF